MTTTDAVAEATAAPVGPERLAGQGLDPHQYESGDRAIHILLTDDTAGPQTDLAITYRDGAYEVWAKRGMIRFQRFYAASGKGYDYRVIEQIGENPIANQDAQAVATIDDELAASKASGFPGVDPNVAYVEVEHVTYPYAYERIAQLFDSPNAPDIAVNPKSYLFGRQPGQHGALDVIQSRSPLVFTGPGIKQGVQTDAPSRQVDIAPTIAHLCGFRLIDGKDSTGRTSSERGVAPDVYLKRQDGRVLDEIIDGDARPERAYIFLLDGQSNTELKWRLENDPDSIPNLRRLIKSGTMFEYGSITNFPSITWPSHNAIGTGAWGGHHDIVNPTYYLRESRETVTPQGQQFDTAKFLGDGVETLYEAFHRVYGPWQGQQGAFTASIHEPCTRGADHATLERRVVGDRDRLREITAKHAGDTLPKWLEDDQKGAHGESIVDNRGTAQAIVLYTDESHPPPKFMFHELTLTDGVGHDYGPHSDGQRAALDETDVRVGHVLAALEGAGLYETTLFIITTDHGMAAVQADQKASQVRAIVDAGMKAAVPDPLIYLIDMAVNVVAHEDGRTAMVEVLANDADASGEQPAVAGAEVTLSGPGAKVLTRAKTDAGGTCGLPLPVNVEPTDLYITVHHDDYNPRHLRLDGTPVMEDLRALLYGPPFVNDDVRAEFRTGGLLSAHLSAIALVAAEIATVEGRLNLAKVLRATALAGRISGLRLERIASGEATSLALFEELHTFQDEIAQRLTDLAEDPSLSAAERASIVSLVNSGSPLRDIHLRAAEALADDRDVSESVIAQFLFGCEECGYIAEASRPDLCPACGGIAGEWQLFAPFYSSTPEHISRRKPAEIVAMLQGDAARLHEVLAGHDDDALRRSPAPGEWCAKEIAGHMIDIAELHNRRLLALLDPEANVPPETTLLPWKIIDGQDYPNATAGALTSRFDAAITEALVLLARLQDGDWRKKADMVSGRVPVIDMASWLANHNLAHMAQLQARLDEI